MHLVQILLPLSDNQGAALPRSAYAETRAELVDRFGGLTAYTRAPADGVWKPSEDQATRDDIVIYEVMVDSLERPWWSLFRQRLETRFRQDHVLIRATEVQEL